MEREELKLELEELAVRFSEGWHEGIKIDALDIALLLEAAEALAQPAQAPVAHREEYWCADLTCKKCYGADFCFKHAPPQRPWLEPTGNEWFEWWRVSNVAHETEVEIDFADFLIIAQAVVAKLKDKNNGT